MLLQQSIEHVSIVYTCNTYFVMHWSMYLCSLYTELRICLIKSYYWRQPNVIRFKEWFVIEDKVMLQNIAMYVANGFELRNNMLHPY